MFDLDSIKKLPSLKLVQSTPLFGLLQVFLNGDYAQLSDWLSKNEASLGESGGFQVNSLFRTRSFSESW